jgi:hypothetical protein
MCCGKSKQGTNVKKDKCACGAYALNFALMEMLDGSCATQDEILTDIYQDIKFDNTNPFGSTADEEYSDPRKMCNWVNTNMKTITAELYVNSNVLSESNPVLAGFWAAAGFDAGDYTKSEGVNLLGTQGSTPAVTAVCAFAWFGGPPPGGGMHFVAIKDKGGEIYACDPYHGKWIKTTKPMYKTSIETKPGSSLMYIGVAVVLTK